MAVADREARASFEALSAAREAVARAEEIVAEREGDALRVDVPAPRGQGTAGANSGTALSLRWPAGEGFGEAWSPTHRVVVARDGERRRYGVSHGVGSLLAGW